MSSSDSELLAQQVSGLNEKITRLEQRLAEVERVNSRLEQAALITARSLQAISGHWDAVYEAMRRTETVDSNEEHAERDDHAAIESTRTRRADERSPLAHS
jgi:hypothetical protein